MDAFAIGLKVADKLIEDKVLDSFIENRYSSYTHGIGKTIVEGTTNFHELEAYALGLSEIKNQSGKTERLRAIVNQYLFETLSSVRI